MADVVKGFKGPRLTTGGWRAHDLMGRVRTPGHSAKPRGPDRSSAHTQVTRRSKIILSRTKWNA